MLAVTCVRLVGVSAVLLGQGLLPPAAAAEPKGKKYALLVGVKKYKHASLTDLAHTENDVEELAIVLKSKQVAFDEVVLLTTTRGEKDKRSTPTAGNFRAELKRLLRTVDKYDLVLVGLAGHGLQITVTDPKDDKREKTESFFCPADAKPTRSTKLADLAETMIPLSELFNELEDSGAGVKLLLVDACRDEPKLGRNPDVDNLPRPSRGTAALFSCKSGERAFETSKLGKGHGVFFHHVIEGLKGKARNNKGLVSWNSLAEYVTTEVSERVPKLIGGGAKQTPHEIKNLTGKPPLLAGADESEGAKGGDAFRANSVWENQASKLRLTVLEREGETFRARFVIGDDRNPLIREVAGTVRNGKVSWLARNVRALRGGVGGDNVGTLGKDRDGDKIDFAYTQGKTSGKFTLRLTRD